MTNGKLNRHYHIIEHLLLTKINIKRVCSPSRDKNVYNTPLVNRWSVRNNENCGCGKDGTSPSRASDCWSWTGAAIFRCSQISVSHSSSMLQHVSHESSSGHIVLRTVEHGVEHVVFGLLVVVGDGCIVGHVVLYVVLHVVEHVVFSLQVVVGGGHVVGHVVFGLQVIFGGRHFVGHGVFGR